MKPRARRPVNLLKLVECVTSTGDEIEDEMDVRSLG